MILSEIDFSKYFILYGHNFVVNGAKRSAIYDLQHENVIFIPNILASILSESRQLTVSQLQEKYVPDSPDLLAKYYHWLFEKDLGFFTGSPEQFPAVEPKWEYPGHLQSAVIEVDFSYPLQPVFEQLQDALCRFMEVRITGFRTVTALQDLFSLFEGKIFNTIDVIIRYEETLSPRVAEKLYESCAKIRKIAVYSAPEDLASNTYKHKGFSYFTENFEETKFLDDFPARQYIVNLEFFAEAREHHPYYNAKVCIDRSGNIKNCLKHKQSFGNVQQQKITDVTATPGFRKLWYACADKISDLKDSELRYCTFSTAGLQEEIAGQYKFINTNLSYEIKK